MEFQGKTFRTPETITGRMTINVNNALKKYGAVWFADAEAIPVLMGLLLEGPHDQVDWLDADVSLYKEAHAGFFTSFGTKMKASEDSSSTDSNPTS